MTQVQIRIIFCFLVYRPVRSLFDLSAVYANTKSVRNIIYMKPRAPTLNSIYIHNTI
jgi:hypothetical protein